MEDLVYWVWLAQTARVPSTLENELIEKFKDAKSIYNAEISEIKNMLGLPLDDERIIKSWKLDDAEKIVKRCENTGIKIIPYNHSAYPEKLKSTIKPPSVIYAKGNFSDMENMLSIGVVGTRKCTEYGMKVTSQICTKLAKRGLTIVSGMAKGIDSIAAESALNVKGKTIAVLGCGANVVYPKENAALMEKICEKGVIISEYPPDTKPMPYYFPARNRIISGISNGIIVIEAPESSGALITADYAQATGRDVFSIPGSIFSRDSSGTNKLIKNGAKIACSADDIFECYKDDLKKIKAIKEKVKNDANDENEKKVLLKKEQLDMLGDDEKMIVNCLMLADRNLEELILLTGKDIHFFNVVLPALEVRGLVKKLSTDEYTLNV